MRNPLTPIIRERLPFQIKTDYPAFERLIGDFYTWLETDDNFLNVLTNFSENSEVNYEVESYVKELLKEIGWDLDKDLAIDYKLLMGTLKEFYLGRGNAESFSYLFKVLFGSDVNVSYPRERLFQLSAASYNKDNVIVTSADNYKQEYEELSTLNITIEGQRSKVIVGANQIIPFYVDGILYLKIIIEETNFNFIPMETVKITLSDLIFLETIYANGNVTIVSGGHGYAIGDEITFSDCDINGKLVVSKVSTGYISNIEIDNGGTGYQVGDRIMKANTLEKGYGFSAAVAEVDTGTGEILTITILNNGFGFTSIPQLKIESTNGVNAVLTATSSNIGGIKTIEFKNEYWKFELPNIVTVDVITDAGEDAVLLPNLASCISKHNKTFKDNLGSLGENSILLDSLFFQNFSYQLKSNISSQHYNDIVEKFLHPVGFERLSIFVSEQELDFPEITSSGLVHFLINSNLGGISTPINSYFQDDLQKIFGSIALTPSFKINTIDSFKYSPNFGYIISDFSQQIPNSYSPELRTLDLEIELLAI